MKDGMMEAFSVMDKTASEVIALEGNFKASLERYANSVSNDYVKHGTDMNESIAKIASRNHLNDEQIQRVVEESNNKVYLAKYAELKHSNERDVTFDRAEAEKVKTASKDGVSDLSKIASSADEPLNAFNSTRNLTGALTPAAPTDIVKLAMEKLASELDKTAKKFDRAKVDFDAHIYKVAGMMIRYDRAGINTDMAFEEICRQNNFRTPMQQIIKEAAEDIIGEEVKAGKLDSDYRLNMSFVDLGAAAPNYSLGAFSKIASMNLEEKKQKQFPVMQIHGTLIKGLPDMVKYASIANDLFAEIQMAEKAYNDVQERTTFKKEASMNKGAFFGFGKKNDSHKSDNQDAAAHMVGINPDEWWMKKHEDILMQSSSASPEVKKEMIADFRNFAKTYTGAPEDRLASWMDSPAK